MTKADLVNEIARSTGMDKNEVIKAVDGFIGAVKVSLAHGNEVQLRGFGTFSVKERAEKKCRNITAGTEVIVPAHNEPKFKAARELKEMVR